MTAIQTFTNSDREMSDKERIDILTQGIRDGYYLLENAKEEVEALRKIVANLMAELETTKKLTVIQDERFQWYLARESHKIKNPGEDMDFVKELLKTTCFREKLKYQTYLALDKITNLVKIGRAVDPGKRIKDMQISNINISLAYLFPGDIENALHKEYKAHKVEREWFSLSEEQIEEIITKYGFVKSSAI